MTQEQADELLKEVRDEPKGHASMDLHKLLEFHEFAADKADKDQSGREFVLRYHPEFPALYVVIYTGETTSVATARRVAEIVDNLRSRTR